MMLAAAKDAGRTALRGAALIALVLGALAFGPRVELWLAPPVSLWEIHNPRVEAGELRWSVLVAQTRDCRASVAWSLGGVQLDASGPPFDFRRGEAAEIGTYRAPLPVLPSGALLSAAVTYNCGLPWGLAPILKSAPIAR